MRHACIARFRGYAASALECWRFRGGFVATAAGLVVWRGSDLGFDDVRDRVGVLGWVWVWMLPGDSWISLGWTIYSISIVSVFLFD